MDLSDAKSVSLAGIEFTVLATPGHTPGSCCLYNAKEQVLFSGDTLFRGSIGRSDLQGGDAKTLARSLARLKELPAEVEVYPGHGPATTIGKERMSNRYW
jgi:glyoxylase-like metal-dependent hydrolase (beta-lactamase superfamily II)